MINARLTGSVIAVLATTLASFVLVSPASAITMKECSVKYKAAQSAGEAEGVSWSAFRKAQCSKFTDESAGKKDDKKPKKVSEKKPVKAAKKSESASSEMSFPSAIAAKFASEKPAKARMHTCLEQYRANKAANTLGRMRWIEKGGGYYKKCNDRLKSND
ncbi:hypothetical protein [Phyllobacterium sp. K27]